MCGISGFVGRGDADDLAAMMAAIAHRGPDGHGHFVDPRHAVHLGHQRLAIVDIAGGAQPMWTQDNKTCIVFNGEIYNHAELRSDLVQLGHAFHTDHSDTEVLLRAYIEWGEDMLIRLNGMFAFCIYDLERKKLFLARDRFGEKPLYYARINGLFAFASELTSLHAHSHIEPKLSFRKLQKYFAYGYVPAPGTIYDNCYKLPGGTALLYDLASGNTREITYWEFRIEPDPAIQARDEEDLAEELRELLIASVKRRLMGDVPVGIFLSGGIDSATALACAAQVSPESRFQTFTLGFQEPTFDESDAARSTADHFRSLHRSEVLDLNSARESICDILAGLDEPMSDPSIVPTSLLARFASKHVKVTLSGDGGDELFAGYDPFLALPPSRFYSALVPAPLHHLVRRCADYLPRSDRNMSLDFRIKRTLRGLSYPPSLWNPVWLSPVDPAEMQELFEVPIAPEELYSEALEVWEASSAGNVIDRTLEFYTRFYLQEGILAKADRASMRSSLESRSIFLDNELVRFCSRLPHQYKLRNGTRKYLLRKAMRPLLPEAVFRRPKKGFGMPISSWLRVIPTNPPLAPIEGVCLDYPRRAWREHRLDNKDHRLFLWAWLSLQLSLPDAFRQRPLVAGGC
jgi:asparagine synthase (glutamine-hydrolysing)